MALPAREIPREQSTRLNNIFRALRREAVSLVAACDALPLKLGDLVSARLQAFISHKEAIEALAGVAGVSTEYENMYSDSFTFTTEKDAIISAIDTLNTYIETQIPKNGKYLSIYEFDADLKIVQRTTSAETPIATIRANAQAIVDLITI